eukprot:COSAG02_NODE_5159_length_4582_cov_3.745483_3_plen_105_part_00
MPDGKTLDLGPEISSALAPEAFAPVADGEGNAALPGPGSLASLIADAISGSELNLDTKKELCVLQLTDIARLQAVLVLHTSSSVCLYVLAWRLTKCDRCGERQV